MHRRGLLVSWGFSLLVAGCGGASPHATTPNELTADQIDADPMALLPSGAGAVANVDARAFYSSGTVGVQLAAATEKMIPLGDDTGFKASRDVDRIVAGTYGSQGADGVAVLSGRFDEVKIEASARAHAGSGDSALTESDYAGRHVFTVSGVGFSVLTPKTALVGSQAALRRALDRVHDRKITREIASWMLETLSTPDASAAAAADFTQPMAAAAVSSLQIPFTDGLQTARIVADFKAPGMHVAGTLAYKDANGASAAARGIKTGLTMEGLVAMAGLAPKLQDVSLKAVDANVQVSMALDDQGMRKLVALLPSILPSVVPSSSQGN